jgi:phage-related minor tail protein
MAKNTRLARAASSVGAAAGRATRNAKKVAKAAKVAREELEVLTNRFEALARDVKKAGIRLQRALR